MDIDVQNIGGLPPLRHLVTTSADEGVEILRRADQILKHLAVQVTAEVGRRYEALRRCRQDPDANCSGLERSYAEAVHERSNLDRVLVDVSSSMAAIRGKYERARAGGGSLLARLHAHLVAAPHPDVLGATAVAGARAGSLGISSGSPRRYSDIGDRLNSHIWNWAKSGTALSPDDIELCRQLDEQFSAAIPLAEPMVLNRSAPKEILEDLKASADDSPEKVAGRLVLGFRCRHYGYVSASETDPYAGSSTRPIHFRIYVPAGTHTLDLRSREEGGTGISAYSWEHEIVLPRDGRIIVRPSSVRATRVGGVLHWDMDVDYLPPR